MTKKIKLRRITAHESMDCVQALADVLVDCVEGGASVSFMLPFPREKAVRFWQSVIEGVARNERVLLVAEDENGRIVGTVQLVMAQSENQPHRADIAKMLVRRDARRQGIAQCLMSEIEKIAQREGKTVLILDTTTGSDAERLYVRMGWKRVGNVRDYALMPDGKLSGATFYSKRLCDAGNGEFAVSNGDCE